ncbi:MAG: response regulator [Desulfobacterales bacterium]|nr:response regulator [Desulfobacterales bacterium]
MIKSGTDKPVVVQLVDDKPENLKILSRILVEHGYRMRTSINGTLALKSAREDPPSLILLDIRMPGMDGYEVCSQLKADESTRDIPVIFISALHEVEDKVKAFSLGGVDFISKPFQEDEVLARIRTHLSIRSLQKDLHEKNITLKNEITKHKRTQEELLKKEKTARTLLNASSDAVVLLDRQGIILDINDSYAQRFHKTKDESVGTCVWDLFRQPDLIERRKANVMKVFETGMPLTMEDEREGMWNHANISPIPDLSGKVTRVAVFAHDITRYKAAEKSLREQALELERSNKDLEQFAYMVSHDLTEPLRMVTSYLKLLERRYKGKLDADADDFIGFAVDGAARMHMLINDMLTLSRVGTRGKPFDPVETGDILEKSLENLSVAVRENNACVTCDPLPKVTADSSQLVQVFQNLISNAIKFKREEPPRIHVTAEKKDTEWVFSFRDNGIGIASEYYDRIFAIFQRLHGRNKYPGTGIGLAVCKKIVERHGGQIWLESQESIGSVFYFTIPIIFPECEN